MEANKIPVRIANKLLPLAQKKKRIKIAVGGRGSTKSTGISDLMSCYMHAGEKVLCVREMQNSIDESVHSTLKDSIKRMELKGFDFLKSHIAHSSGGGSAYKGLARNPDSVKSYQGFHRLWGEEAQSLSQESLDMLIPTMRKSANMESEPELWFSCNRGASKDPFSQTMLKPFEKQLKLNGGYYEDDLRIIIDINWQDNPWFMESGLNAQRLADKQHMSTAKYNHIWEGDYNDEVEYSIIPTEWFDACIDAHIKKGFEPKGAEVVSFDPSDTGGDAKGLAYRHGVVFLDVQEWQSGDVNTALDKALDYAIHKKVDLFVWDGDGLGAPLKRDVSRAFDGKRIDWAMFKGSEAVDLPNAAYLPHYNADNQQDRPKTNKETFKNKRAQFYIDLRDRCYKTFEAVTKNVYHDPDSLISFSSQIKGLDLLRSEICRIPQKPTGTGLIQIMSKVDMKRIGIESPNMADSVMMSLKKIKPKQAQNYALPSVVSYN